MPLLCRAAHGVPRRRALAQDVLDHRALRRHATRRRANGGDTGDSMASHLNRGFAWMLALCVAVPGGAHAAADPAKVLRIAIPRAETGFDPAQASEIYSGAIIAAIMEPLLTFDYFARPAKVAPLTAEALPDVAQNGKRFTFKLRKGTFFAADPAFNGKRRELVAADYA